MDQSHSIGEDLVRPLPQIDINTVFFETVPGTINYTEELMKIKEHSQIFCDRVRTLHLSLVL